MRLCSCIFSFNGMSELQLVLTIYYCLHNKTVPSQLTGMTVLRQVHRGAPALQVMWNAQRELPFTRYQVEISTSQDSWEEMPVNINSTEFTFESLTPGTEYHVRATAFNNFGMSSWTYQTATTYDGEDYKNNLHHCTTWIMAAFEKSMPLAAVQALVLHTYNLCNVRRHAIWPETLIPV